MSGKKEQLLYIALQKMGAFMREYPAAQMEGYLENKKLFDALTTPNDPCGKAYVKAFLAIAAEEMKNNEMGN